MNKVIILFLLVYFLVSCNERQDHKNTVESATMSDTLDIVDDEFINRVIGSNSSRINFSQIEKTGNYVQTLITSDSLNFDDRYIKDSLYVLSSKYDTLLYAKAYSGVFLWKMHLQDTILHLDTNININCDKKIFVDKFKLVDFKRVVKVRDDMGGNNFYFVFENGILKEIFFYYDFDGLN